VIYHEISLVFYRYTHEPCECAIVCEKTCDKWDIPWYTTRKWRITILYHANENTTKIQRKRNSFFWAEIGYATHDGNVELNTVEYTTAFLNSDWLYFLWLGINTHTSLRTKKSLPYTRKREVGILKFLRIEKRFRRKAPFSWRISVDGTGGGVLPYMGYIGMCGPKGYGFSAVLVINRVSILAICRHFGHK